MLQDNQRLSSDNDRMERQIGSLRRLLAGIILAVIGLAVYAYLTEPGTPERRPSLTVTEHWSDKPSKTQTYYTEGVPPPCQAQWTHPCRVEGAQPPPGLEQWRKEQEGAGK